jgi:hypothetical protein
VTIAEVGEVGAGMAQAASAKTKPWLKKSRTRRRPAAGPDGLSPRCSRVRLSLLLRWVTGLKSFSMLHREKPEILGLDEFVNLCLITKMLSNAPGLNKPLFSAEF